MSSTISAGTPADPANRLVAGELEARWNKALAHVAEVEGKIAVHGAAMPMPVFDPPVLTTLALMSSWGWQRQAASFMAN
jgi:hypothetical protein